MNSPQQVCSPTRSLALLHSIHKPGLRASELNEKWSRLEAVLDRSQLSAILLQCNENIAWITAGQVEARVLIPGETAVTSLLLTRTGRKYYLAPNNEAPRLADEEFCDLEYEPVITPWHEDGVAAIHRLAGDGAIGTDHGLDGLTPVDMAPLRAPLTAAEVERFRWLAERTAAMTAEALAELEPGITEDQMSADVAQRLLAEGILPTVLLMAADDRIRKYKHAVSRGAVLERYGMLNLCARKWGLAVSITRFVHFGAPSQQLTDAFAACAEVNAKLLHASRSGATSAELYAVAENAYRIVGFPGEEQFHHQGGPAGYMEREWIATPKGQQTLTETEVLAWNPSIRGAKVEDTALLHNGAVEVLTLTPSLPQITTTIEGIAYPSADLLIR
ncbi:M24 family metallopeptidase [Alloacidobacterium dinghuense]|uniref:M24 family metallopeptidase n=1 Tax=Alloacidobacterium dinghuense TaxID=2763107 RepID=A0A7G8BCM4_9BACT|nr:M24 family metallopeptidase [Alloacidobacterium dinghuense]QNI30294.1 M24 family metallopeptidase [Alloacidobacterium dinghuense]